MPIDNDDFLSLADVPEPDRPGTYHVAMYVRLPNGELGDATTTFAYTARNPKHARAQAEAEHMNCVVTQVDFYDPEDEEDENDGSL